MIFDAKIAQRADGKITPTQNFCTRFTDFLKEAGVGERPKSPSLHREGSI